MVGLVGPVAKEAVCNFHAERRGKTGIDGSFRRAKERLGEFVDYGQVKTGGKTLRNSILEAYQKANEGTSEEYAAVFLPDPSASPKRQLRIRDVRKIHRISSDLTGRFEVSYASGEKLGPRKLDSDVATKLRNLTGRKLNDLRGRGAESSYVSQMRKKFDLPKLR